MHKVLMLVWYNMHKVNKRMQRRMQQEAVSRHFRPLLKIEK